MLAGRKCYSSAFRNTGLFWALSSWFNWDLHYIFLTDLSDLKGSIKTLIHQSKLLLSHMLHVELWGICCWGGWRRWRSLGAYASWSFLLAWVCLSFTQCFFQGITLEKQCHYTRKEQLLQSPKYSRKTQGTKPIFSFLGAKRTVFVQCWEKYKQENDLNIETYCQVREIIWNQLKNKDSNSFLSEDKSWSAFLCLTKYFPYFLGKRAQHNDKWKVGVLHVLMSEDVSLLPPLL